MLATPVNVLVALVIAGLVSLPVQVDPVAPAVNVPVEPSQEGPSGGAAPAANKVQFSGSSIETVRDTDTMIFDRTVKIGGPKDLLIEVNLECALWTTVFAIDDDDSNTPAVDVPYSEVEARVSVWVEIDGQVVPVSGDDVDYAETEVNDIGRVVFCDRVHGIGITENDGDEDNETIKNHLETRAAQSFQWVWIDAGSGEHTLQVFADLEQKVNEGEGEAHASIGKRTLIVDVANLANGATI